MSRNRAKYRFAVGRLNRNLLSSLSVHIQTMRRLHTIYTMPNIQSWPRISQASKRFGRVLLCLVLVGFLWSTVHQMDGQAFAKAATSSRPLTLTKITAHSADTTTRLSLQIGQASSQSGKTANIGNALSPKIFTLAAKNGKPARLVIDLSQTDFNKKTQKTAKSLTKTLSTTPYIRTIRMARREGGITRLVAELSDGATYKSHHYASQNYGSGALSITIKGKQQIPKKTHKAVFRRFSGIPYPQVKPQVAGRTTSQTKATKKTRRKHVIVIDPGHGGRDPGAIGQKGVKEENVTLAAALELRRQLQKTGRYKVVLTRTGDRYISHDKRVLIARKAGADLFISLHADSLSKPATRGASVYTLAARAETRGQNLVHKQNWILDVDLAAHSGNVSDILVDLAQRKTLSKSSKFADVLVPQLKKQTKLLGNTHRQAGYYVLLAPDVPAVLLEMGFLSNLTDEKLLNSKSHRKKLMKTVTKAINLYFKP